VAIVIHDHRWCLGLRLTDSEKRYDEMENLLATAPAIAVPTITLEGDAMALRIWTQTFTLQSSAADTSTGRF
jgi:hypothetical protein